MLCLSQKLGDTVDITLPDGRIATVVILAIERNKVRVGYSFPLDVVVNRRAVTEKIREEEVRS